MKHGDGKCFLPHLARTVQASQSHVLFDLEADHATCRTIEEILGDVSVVISSVGDGQPRSVIQENLLRAGLKINDAILPVRLEDYIAKQLMLAGSSTKAKV